MYNIKKYCLINIVIWTDQTHNFKPLSRAATAKTTTSINTKTDENGMRIRSTFAPAFCAGVGGGEKTRRLILHVLAMTRHWSTSWRCCTGSGSSFGGLDLSVRGSERQGGQWQRCCKAEHEARQRHGYQRDEYGHGDRTRGDRRVVHERVGQASYVRQHIKQAVAERPALVP